MGVGVRELCGVGGIGEGFFLLATTLGIFFWELCKSCWGIWLARFRLPLDLFCLGFGRRDITRFFPKDRWSFLLKVFLFFDNRQISD